jgi:hypothetical protein
MTYIDAGYQYATLNVGLGKSAMTFQVPILDRTTTKAGKLVSVEKRANASYKLTKAPSQLHEISSFKAEIKNLPPRRNLWVSSGLWEVRARGRQGEG